MTLDDVTSDRVRRLSADPALTAAEVHRRIRSGADGGPPTRCSYGVVQRAVKRFRSMDRPIRSADPASMADRILSVLDRELERIEDANGRADLERLDKIAATLRRIEAVRPKAEGRQKTSLRSLLPEVDPQTSEAEDRSDPKLSEAPIAALP